MSAITALRLAEMLSGTAREHYEADGHVAPALFMTDATGHGLCMLPPDGHPTDTLTRACFFLSPAFKGQLTFVAAVTEAWVKSFKEDDLPESFDRGDLQRAHENLDPEVRTCVVTTVLDIKQGEDFTVMINDINTGPDHTPVWERSVHEGRAEGMLPERLFAAATIKPDREPPDVPLRAWAELMVAMNWAKACIEIGDP